MRVHNLREQESPDILTQTFENWPSRHSTKKSYCKVTAYKSYKVTDNRFQLLDNLQENDSAVDVPGKSSQPGKDYCSAVKVSSARVKGDHQIAEDIGKTHFHNANFNNPDMKNNLTVPVIVKGQALTSKSNPVNRQSNKFSHENEHKVLIIGDNHTRLCATNVRSEIKGNYDVQPGAGADILVNTANSDIINNKKRCWNEWRILPRNFVQRWGGFNKFS